MDRQVDRQADQQVDRQADQRQKPEDWTSRFRERKVRRLGSSGSPGKLRPTALSGRRTSSLLLLSPPTVSPLVKIRSPPPDSHPVAPLETTVTVWLVY